MKRDLLAGVEGDGEGEEVSGVLRGSGTVVNGDEYDSEEIYCIVQYDIEVKEAVDSRVGIGGRGPCKGSDYS